MAPETTPERFRRVEEIFNGLQSLSLEERPVYLEDCCAGDEGLKADVESLLAAAEEEEQSGAAQGKQTEKPDHWLGRESGNYRIDSMIGRGGMGAVYLASRTGDVIAQQVAIKVMASRMISGMMNDRFKSERQILASLVHPNIARLLGGGTADRGELFLVMEYVDGLRLDHYVARHKLGLQGLLGLFLQVCDAVDYAHRNLIVHRV